MTSSTEKLTFSVGGEFELAWVDSGKPLQQQTNPKYPSLWLDTGRAALLLIAKHIKVIGGNHRVWLPAYACASVTQAFTQAGYIINYYEVAEYIQGGNLTLPKLERGDTILFIQYFGFEIRGLSQLAPMLKQEGIWVIEDWVQASLNLDSELRGDFAVTSYRKFLSVPDGAVIYSKEPFDLPKTALEEADEFFVSSKLLAKMMRANDREKTDFLAILDRAESSLETTIVPRKISFVSNWLLAHTDYSDIIRKRQSNFSFLVEALKKLEEGNFIRLPYRVLQKIEVPLGLPVVIEGGRRDKLRAFLANKQIYCPIHWILDYLPHDQFQNEKALAASIMTVPIDQRMSADHIEWVASAFNQFFRE